jgi:hypothetical protein
VTSTTIRVDTDTHRALADLAKASGATLLDTVRAAVHALQRQRLGAEVAAQLSVLRSDPTDWADYLTEAADTDVADGIS